jgi:hypothetical protein
MRRALLLALAVAAALVAATPARDGDPTDALCTTDTDCERRFGPPQGEPL